jgi:O-antigen chain-terminating methyltransferase
MHIADQRGKKGAAAYFAPFIKWFGGCSSVLDVASGQGHFLALLKSHGINAEGIEIDSDLCAVSASQGLKVSQGDFFEFLKTRQPGRFDAVMCSHIVEHLTPDRVEKLFSLLHAATAPGSTLVILTPNIANIRRAVGDFWRDPTHVRPYPISALDKLLRRTNWLVIDAGEHTDRKPSSYRSFLYGVRNALLGRYWVGDDVFVVARRS